MFRLPLALTLRPSPRALGVIALLHGLGLTGVLLAPLPSPLQATAAILILLELTRAVRHHGSLCHPPLPNGERPRRIWLAGNGLVGLQGNSPDRFPARIQATSSLLPGLVILRVRGMANEYRATFFFSPDNLRFPAYRRLKVWLRWLAGSAQHHRTSPQ